jgi:hypothetical protein
MRANVLHRGQLVFKSAGSHLNTQKCIGVTLKLLNLI